MTEGRRQKTEGRRQRAEDRGQRRQMTDVIDLGFKD
jgi:hypothetical protein